MKYLMTCAILTASTVAGYAQAQGSPAIKVVIDSNITKFKTSDPIKFNLKIENHGANLTYYKEDKVFGSTLEVIDFHGKDVYQDAFQNPVPPLESVGTVSGSTSIGVLNPGESRTSRAIYLPRPGFLKPGIYKLRYSMTELPSKVRVQSNFLMIEISK